MQPDEARRDLASKRYGHQDVGNKPPIAKFILDRITLARDTDMPSTHAQLIEPRKAVHRKRRAFLKTPSEHASVRTHIKRAEAQEQL
ncbi:hypothetical protein MPH_09209 [Macrophomina phaseolina MS6]|uniref:Uncharacterized protein n=1 Tax=Macrophomina phaseolina (strain MS6) TaxID=1126212 RepID=K2RLE6_MACPH|nr:hypothetical protein MPH_09209 [Macrophomina phaseolina MS6]